MEERKVVRRVKKKRKNRMPIVGVLVIAVCVITAIAVKFILPDDEDDNSKPQDSIEDMLGKQEEEQKQGYAISSSREEAVKVAEKVLEDGGNAVDAAIAMSYTLAVVEPSSSGLGGGGCMVIYDPNTDDYYYYDYTAEAATSGFSRTIMVPGFVDGMETLHKDLGTMPLAELIEPAIEYCDGVKVSKELSNRISNASGVISKDSAFYKDGSWLSEGDILVQPDLKETLEKIVNEGSESFYTGELAKTISDEIGIPLEDLEKYDTECSEVVKSSYMEYEVISAGMPYSGVTLIQMLKMAEKLEIPEAGDDNKAFVDGLRTITVASHVDRIKNVYDYEDEDVDIDYFVSDEYIAELLKVSADNVTYEEDESEDTTGFTVMDKNGMLVACTNTLSSFFGCKKDVCGFFMNNSGRNFGVGVNEYEPGKRPRTHIAPTILRSEDKAMAIASPGGNVIVKVLGSVLIDICQFGTDAQKAVDKQRIMFKENSLIYYEIGYETKAIAKATGTGYSAVPVSNHPYFGCVSISGYSVEEGFFAAADERRQGDCSVYNE